MYTMYKVYCSTSTLYCTSKVFKYMHMHSVKSYMYTVFTQYITCVLMSITIYLYMYMYMYTYMYMYMYMYMYIKSYNQNEVSMLSAFCVSDQQFLQSSPPLYQPLPYPHKEPMIESDAANRQ